MCAAILCLESSGTLCSAAVCGFERETFISSEPGQKHTEVFIGMIRSALEAAGGSVDKLDAVCFANGPGAFTGIRVACGLAQGIGWARSIPLIPVGSLTALAYCHRETLREGSRLLAAVDARMHECYSAVYRFEDGKFTEVLAPNLCKPEDLTALSDDYGAELLCGNAFRIYAQEVGTLEGKKLLSDEDVNAEMLVPLAKAYLAEGLTVSADKAAPLYVRDHVAMTIQERKDKNYL